MFSKTKQIVKLPLRRTDQFQQMEESLASDYFPEIPFKNSEPMKIQVFHCFKCIFTDATYSL